MFILIAFRNWLFLANPSVNDLITLNSEIGVVNHLRNTNHIRQYTPLLELNGLHSGHMFTK